MPALLDHGQEAAVHQLGEMRARRGRRHAGNVGELARGQRAAVGQRIEHVGARRLADQRRDFRHAD
jgi:hypothetical protein